MKRVLIYNPYIPTLGGGEKHMAFLCKSIFDYYSGNVMIDILVHDYNDIRVDSVNYTTVEDISKMFGVDLYNVRIRKYHAKHFDLKATIISMKYDVFVNFKIFSRAIPLSKINIYECMFPPKKEQFAVKANSFMSIKQRIQNRLFKLTYDVFICNSVFTETWLHNYWGEVKSRVVYPPVFSNIELDNRYVELYKKSIILSVGRFFVGSHSKRQLELVKTFVNNQDKLGEYEYHLVGAISNKKEDLDYLDQVKKMAEKSTRVFIHENMKFDELIDLYRKSKIFWHATGMGISEKEYPERMEHFGITTVEAMSYGAVPVVINKGGQPEIVQDGENGYLWDKEEELIEKTMMLIQNEEERQMMSLKAVIRSREFSIESFDERNRRIFNELQI